MLGHVQLQLAATGCPGPVGTAPPSHPHPPGHRRTWSVLCFIWSPCRPQSPGVLTGCFLVWAQGVSAPSLLGPDNSAVGLPCAPVGWSAAALAYIRWMLVASPSRADQECLRTSPDGGTESPSSGQKTGMPSLSLPRAPSTRASEKEQFSNTDV